MVRLLGTANRTKQSVSQNVHAIKRNIVKTTFQKHHLKKIFSDTDLYQHNHHLFQHTTHILLLEISR